jgi:ABC-type uncharacterized transport system substrate-binding protein
MAVFIVTPSPLTAARRGVIIETAARLGLPAIYSFRFYVASGGLISYGIDQLETVREAASYVGRILHGASPATPRYNCRPNTVSWSISTPRKRLALRFRNLFCNVPTR